jgi:hypothetical protein
MALDAGDGVTRHVWVVAHDVAVRLDPPPAARWKAML